MENRKWWHIGRRNEKREQTLEEILIQGYLGDGVVTKEQALNIPSVSACVELISTTIASLPICLYKETDEKVTEVMDDYRTELLNDETQDLLDSNQFKRNLIEDYLLEGNGYAYIDRDRNTIRALYYVEPKWVQISPSTDPIFKDGTITINGQGYRDFELIKFCRQSKNGMTGKGIVKQNNKALCVAYNTLLFEDSLLRSGGGKKGFLKSVNRISSDAIEELKRAWKSLYGNVTDSNVVVLNNGLEFQEATLTSVELQMNQNKKTNSDEICKMFLVPPSVLDGTASEKEYGNYIKSCIMPIITALETVLNRELLLNKEKGKMYFSFDTNELLRASVKERYSAYNEAIKGGWITKNEIRYIEDFEPINGLDIVTMSLGEVIYDVKSETFFTPNMNAITDTGGEIDPTDQTVLGGQTGATGGSKDVGTSPLKNGAKNDEKTKEGEPTK